MTYQTVHYLVIPNAVTGLAPGQPIYFARDDIAVGRTYAGSDGFAHALVPSGALTLTLGDGRNPPTLVIEMQARDCLLHPEGRVSRVTPYWADLLEIREMGHMSRGARSRNGDN